jgi:MFS transporter, DHA1 family, multidrug resistance protein
MGVSPKNQYPKPGASDDQLCLMVVDPNRARRHRPPFAIAPESKLFIILISSTAALPALAIDACLASLPAIGSSFEVKSTAPVVILSIYLVGFVLGQLLFGPLSDRWGRRPALLTGCVLFALGGAGCALAPSFTSLVCCRFVQGAGAAAGAVIGSTIVRDLFTGTPARIRLAHIGAMAAVAPVVAPTLGSVIAAAAGWRSIFLSLAIAGTALVLVLFFGLEESVRVYDRRALMPRRLLLSYWQVLSHPTCLLSVLAGGLSFGALFAYISGSAFVFIDVFHLDARVYAALFAVNALAIGIGAFVSGRLSKRGISPGLLILSGMIIAFCANGLLLAGALRASLTAVSIMPMLVLNTFSSGLITPNAVHTTLQPLPRIAGVASSTFFSVRVLGGAIASELVALWYHGTPLAMAGTMALFAACSLVVGVVLFYNQSSTRVNLHSHGSDQERQRTP